MLVNFKINEIDERVKAVGIPFKHKGISKIMWIPKSLIENKAWKEQGFVDIPDWIYDKKVTELFFV